MRKCKLKYQISNLNSKMRKDYTQLFWRQFQHKYLVQFLYDVNQILEIVVIKKKSSSTGVAESYSAPSAGKEGKGKPG